MEALILIMASERGNRKKTGSKREINRNQTGNKQEANGKRTLLVRTKTK